MTHAAGTCLQLSIVRVDRAIHHEPLPCGDAGTERTIEIMRLLAREPATPVATNPAGVFAWAKRFIRFKHDPPGREVLVAPEVVRRRVLYEGGFDGDCDDSSTFIAAQLLALGHKAAFVTIARDLGNYEHVYAALIAEDGTPIPMDAQETDSPGQEVFGVRKRRVWVI